MGRLALLASALLVAAWAAPAARADSRYLDLVFGDWTLRPNLEYGSAPNEDGEQVSLRLDLYEPRRDVAPERPVLIYAHGGAFRKGMKESGHDGPYAMNFAVRGFVAASIDYRLDGSEQEATDDMQAAVRWFRAHATELRIDPKRIAVIGSSSGAVMALSTTFAPEDPGSSGNPGFPSDVAAGLSISGDAQHPDTITTGDPPIAMFHAQDDTTIPYAAAQANCEQTKAMGNVCDFYSYPSGGHPPPFAIANREDITEKSSDFMVRREGIDTLPPSTVDDVPAGYRAHPVQVTLGASDAGESGLYRTYYTTGVDPPAPTNASQVYDPAAKPALADGERIRFFSIDRAGNAEPARTSARAKVDGEAPVTTDDVPEDYRTSPVAVTLDAHDAGGSGLARTYYTTGAHPPAPTTASAVYDPGAKPALRDGERISYLSTDGAGNAEPARTSAPAKVDGEPPATTDDVPDGFSGQPVTVTLDAADVGGSGLAATHYTTGTDPPAPTSASRTYDAGARPVLGDGERIRYFSTDGAGNAEAVRTSKPAKVDGEPPASSAEAATGATASPAMTVDYEAADAGAGLDRVELYAKGPLDSGYELAATESPAEPASSFEYRAAEGLGDYDFYTVAYDAVGNAEPAAEAADAVTTLVPRTRAAALASSELTAATDGSVTLPLTNPNPFPVSGRATIETARALTLRAGGPRLVRRLGSATFAIPANGSGSATVAIRPALRQLLAKRGRLWVRVTRTTAGAGGERSAGTIVRLRAPAVRGY